MKTVGVHAAKTGLSRLIARVTRGEEVVIARGKTPVAKLVSLRPTTVSRKFGAMRGRARVDRKFFEALPKKELDAWES